MKIPLNYGNEDEFHLADIIRGWLKDTYSGFTVEKDVFARLHLSTPLPGYDWLKLNIIVSRSSLTPKVWITATREDNEYFYEHTYQILSDGIRDMKDPDNVNQAYNDDFIKKFKAEIDEILKGEWVDSAEADRLH